MATYKRIWISDKRVGYATKAEVSPNITNAEPVPTFDGGVPNGNDEITWTVNIDKVRYGKVIDYVNMEKLLLSMFKNPKTVTVEEVANAVDGEMKVTTKVYKAVLTDKKYTIDVESNTVENLSFTGASMKKFVNGEEITY